MPNRLIDETSPYLLQHAHNPVDWYPWGPEALARARADNKPIMLSIGYSACHWCHVMERESFEDHETARIMNEHFVSIKVDREERPDLDSIYMSAVQSMTGRGGWPMTVFLTPEGLPFYGGTYFPPVEHGQMPSFKRVLLSIADAYKNRQTDIQQNAQRMKSLLERGSVPTSTPGLLATETLDQAYENLASRYDATYGGFGGAPKFPQPMSLEFLLRVFYRTRGQQALSMLEHTLVHMARGGIYDQLGGGFHRYSVDDYWLVPHFEKMLYDNALLSRVYLRAYQVTGDPFYRHIVQDTLDYVRREMTDPQGGFYSTQDADSEGEEGKFYVWSAQELEDTLGAEDATKVARYFGVSSNGNFEGRNILTIAGELAAVASELGMSLPELEEVVQAARAKLLAVRERRVWPERDDKIITAWNGLMLRSFAEAAAALGRKDYQEVAVANAEFVLGNLYRDGRLLRTYRDGRAKGDAFLEDYAFYADGLLALYESTFDIRWFHAALELADTLCQQFWDEDDGGFFDTSKDHETLVSRPKEVTDNAIPAGNSVTIELLLRLARLTGRTEYEQKATAVLRGLSDYMRQHPTAFGHLLSALELQLAPSQEIAVVGPSDDPATRALLSVVWNHYLPHRVIALGAPEDAFSAQEIALLEDRDQLQGRPTAYVCENFACMMPVTDPDALAKQLGLGGSIHEGVY